MMPVTASGTTGGNKDQAGEIRAVEEESLGGDGCACWWIGRRPHLNSLPLAFGQTCIQTTLSDDGD
jgi:hypothetical protein